LVLAGGNWILWAFVVRIYLSPCQSAAFSRIQLQGHRDGALRIISWTGTIINRNDVNVANSLSSDTTGATMAKATAKAARSDTLAGEAWAAGCRDVQTAINWATGIGEVVGPPFQSAFRRLLAAQDVPSISSPPAAPGTGSVEDRSKRSRQTGQARTDEDGKAKRTRTARPKLEGNGPVADEPAVTSAPPRRTGTTADSNSGSPAEFVEDMRKLRQLVAKYGKKGLSDLVNMLAG
jgi:hypothetical protein